ncbi:RDD family protein [Candidatus Sumerlaeota bacterium]|nr:RDD family protein [Candidatus Sumerlaeota bacterium]
MPEDKNLEEKKTPAMMDPRAGFWVRAVSLLMDIIVLNFLFHGLTFLFREQLFRIAPYTEYLGAALVFLYFSLLNGPLGKGRTIGKFLFSIRVQDGEGNPLSLIASFKRTIIQLITPSYVLLILDIVFDKSISSQAFPYQILSSLLISFVAANGLLIALHPLKQGFHDQFARSLVVKGGAKVTHDHLKSAFQTTLLSSKARTPASALQFAGLAFIVIFAFLTWIAYQQIGSEQWRKNNDLIKEIRTEFAINGFKLSEIRAMTKSAAKEKKGKEQLAQPETPQIMDAVTSGTYVEGKPPFLIRMKYMALRDITKDEVESNEKIKLMLPKLKKWFQERIPGIMKREIEEGLIPDSIEVIFGENFSLFLYTHEKEEHRFDIQLDVEEFLKLYREKK